MKVNDRVCMALVAARQPYNIVRVVDINMAKPSRATVYLSLLKRQFELGVGDTIETHLQGQPIEVTLLDIDQNHERPNDRIKLLFTGNDAIEFKPLAPKESYCAKDQAGIRHGTNVQRKEHSAPPDTEHGP